MRLTGRGRESGPEVRRRLETARREMSLAASYDHRVTNDRIEDTVQQLASLVREVRDQG